MGLFHAGCLSWKVYRQTLAMRGLQQSIAPFQDLQGHRECLLPGPCVTRLFTDCNWSPDRLKPNYRDPSDSAMWLTLVGLHPGASALWPSVAEVGSWATSVSATGTKLWMPIIPPHMGGYSFSQIPWHMLLGTRPSQMGLEPSSQGCRTVARYVTKTMIGKSATWEQTLFSKWLFQVLNGTGFHNLLHGSQSFQKGTFVCRWMLNYCCS